MHQPHGTKIARVSLLEKINKHQMIMINKKTIKIATIILNSPSVQHTFNKLVMNFSITQINYAQNDACT